MFDEDQICDMVNVVNSEYVYSLCDRLPGSEKMRERCLSFARLCEICFELTCKMKVLHIPKNNQPHQVCAECFDKMIRKDMCPFCREPTNFKNCEERDDDDNDNNE